MRAIERSSAFKRDYKREAKGRHKETLYADLRLSAAMYGKGTFGKAVNVFRLDNDGKVISKALNVKVNDTGPFALDERGRVLRPFQAHPTRIVDLKVYKELTGFPDCNEGPGVIHVRVERRKGK